MGRFFWAAASITIQQATSSNSAKKHETVMEAIYITQTWNQKNHVYITSIIIYSLFSSIYMYLSIMMSTLSSTKKLSIWSMDPPSFFPMAPGRSSARTRYPAPPPQGVPGSEQEAPRGDPRKSARRCPCSASPSLKRGWRGDELNCRCVFHMLWVWKCCVLQDKKGLLNNESSCIVIT